MRDSTLRHCVLGGGFALALIAAPLPAQDAAPAPPDAELKRKTEEVERLQQELRKAQDDLRQLREDNERLKRQQAQPAPAPKPAQPAKPLAQVPTVQPSDLLEAADLVLYYLNDATAADERFKRRRFRLRGVVEELQPTVFVRRYNVHLESPDKSLRVVCEFEYPDTVNAVLTRKDGDILVGIRSGAPEVLLFKRGQTVTLEGRCQGRKGVKLEFSGCKVAR